MDNSIYLDNNATTPLDKRALDAMMPYLTNFYGNASSISHKAGRWAAEVIETSRKQVARLIGAIPAEIIFTSGATEAINMVIKGIFKHYQIKGKHFITCQTEHKAVLEVFTFLEKEGAEVTYLPVNSQGLLNLDELEEAIRPDTVMIALMYANNETGVINPVAEIGRICEQHEVLFFCDATQVAGKIPIDVTKDGIDLLCLSAHKLYGPKGIGAVYVKRRNKRIQIGPFIHGGGQEGGMRGGTLNVPAIAGFGEAAAISQKEGLEENKRLADLRDLLETSILANITACHINGQSTPRLPNTSNICFQYVKGEEIMVNLPNIALAAGSACTSGKREPSHVLLAMGLSLSDAGSCLRFSLGRFTTIEEIEEVIASVTQVVIKLRQESPIWTLHLLNKL
ncbi:cysteine desulfurase IscS [bacterium A37T11]|nr:cysteine desulfurase IscS [bacterium A37T11]